MRLLFRLALLAMASAVGAGLVAFFLVFEAAPAVERTTELTPAHIERAQRILRNNDPRRLRTGAVRTVEMSAADADVAVNYLAHRYADGSAEMQLRDGAAEIRASLRPPRIPGNRYLNVAVVLSEGDPVPAMTRVRVGALPVPVSVARMLISRALPSTAHAELAILHDAVRAVEFEHAGVRLTYEWQSELAEAVRSALVPGDDRQRLRAYQEALAAATMALPGRVSLVDLLPPLFVVALERSQQGDAVSENRAALLVLTSFVVGQPLGQIVPEARSWPRPRRRAVTLSGRDDLAKHFMVSAALSANTGGPFADAVGLYKEVADSQGGSGFSFVDLAADRAGSRLGALAEATGAAGRLQAALAAGTSETALMPATTELEEGLSEGQFRQQFGDVNSADYHRLVARIDSRIDGLPLFASLSR